MNDIYEIMQEYNAIIQAETNEKIRKALGLFLRVDRNYKRIILFSTGFSGKITGVTLRAHFNDLDLLDELDMCIENMEHELEQTAARQG